MHHLHIIMKTLLNIWKKFVKWQPFEGKYGPLEFLFVVCAVILFRIIFNI